MPFYDYRCQNCGKLVTVRQKMGAAAPKSCPNCGEDALKKVMSLSSVTIKGRLCDCPNAGAADSFACHNCCCPHHG